MNGKVCAAFLASSAFTLVACDRIGSVSEIEDKSFVPVVEPATENNDRSADHDGGSGKTATKNEAQPADQADADARVETQGDVP